MSQGGAAAVHTSEADGRYTSADILRNIFGLQSYESAKHVGEEKMKSMWMEKQFKASMRCLEGKTEHTQ